MIINECYLSYHALVVVDIMLPGLKCHGFVDLRLPSLECPDFKGIRLPDKQCPGCCRPHIA